VEKLGASANVSALTRALDAATTALAAEMVGGMQRTLELTVAYAKTRKTVRQAHWNFPGGAAHVRRHVSGDRKRTLGSLLRRVGARRKRTGCRGGRFRG